MTELLEQINGINSIHFSFTDSFSPIPANGSLIYNYTVQQNGTFWIHSHIGGQYPDGLRSAFIIRNPYEPYHYDKDITISVSDWYHSESKDIVASYMSPDNPTGAIPVPQSALMNESQNTTIEFEPSMAYRLRFVNFAAFATFRLWIEDHEMRIIEVDGIYTEERTLDTITLTPAQRVSVLVVAKNNTQKNYALVASMDTSMFATIPAGFNPSAFHFFSH
jgi:iron transport multicopper oxidase